MNFTYFSSGDFVWSIGIENFWHVILVNGSLLYMDIISKVLVHFIFFFF